MRVDLKKILFVGLQSERTRFYQRAQNGGLIDFLELNSKKFETPFSIQELLHAIKIVRGLPSLEQEMPNSRNPLELAEEINRVKNIVEKKEEELRLLKLEMARIEAFGDFNRSDLQYIAESGNRITQFYCSKKNYFESHPLPKEVFWVGSDHGLDYFVGFNKAHTHYEGLIEMKVEHPLNELRNQRYHFLNELHQAEALLKEYAKYSTFLHRALTHEMNHHELSLAQESAEQPEKGIFSAMGWVPENRLLELKKVVEPLHVYFSEIKPDQEEIIPTCLQNKGVPKIGEDLVHIYDVPSSTDKDPSLWVLGAFALFFSLIVGDAGYGLVLLLTALYIRYRLGKLPKRGKRVWILALMLSVACIAWGTMAHAFFGISISPHSSLRKISLLDWLVEKKADYHVAMQDSVYQEWTKKIPETSLATHGEEFIMKGITISGEETSYTILDKFTDNMMMEIALFIGIVHLTSSFLRYIGRNPGGWGWIAFLWGSYLYVPNFLGATSMVQFLGGISSETAASQGLLLIEMGLAWVVIVALIKQKWFGLFEITNILQVSSDVLSYLRLYALGLAGGIMSSVINDMASSAGIVFGVMIAIFGHSVNLVLGIMGGVIHGLRLNFLEWYHYSFEGGGRLFRPLRKIESEKF